MSNDDTRGIESPDRSIESHLHTDGGVATDSIRDRLREIDQHTRAMLVAIYNPSGTAIEDVDAETRAEAAAHVRQMRAEASHVGLALLGPTATMHYSPFAQADGPIADRRHWGRTRLVDSSRDDSCPRAVAAAHG